MPHITENKIATTVYTKMLFTFIYNTFTCHASESLLHNLCNCFLI